MYIATIPNRNSPPAILLRESYREHGKVKNRTLANLSSLPPHSIDILRRSLKGENLVSTDAFEIVENGSPAHGHVDAVMTAMRRLDFSSLICSRRSRQRDLVVAMVVARILEPKSKLATTAWWKEERQGIFIDYNQVARDRTIASAYSVSGRSTPDASNGSTASRRAGGSVPPRSIATYATARDAAAKSAPTASTTRTRRAAAEQFLEELTRY